MYDKIHYKLKKKKIKQDQRGVNARLRGSKEQRAWEAGDCGAQQVWRE